MRDRIVSTWSIVALVAVGLTLGVGGTARAAGPLVFLGQNAVVTQAQVTLNGAPTDPSTYINLVKSFNNPSYIILFPDGTFGMIPSDPFGGTVQTGFPLYGTLSALPDGSLHLVSRNNVFHNGTDTGSSYISGVIFPVNGQFYAVLTYVGVDVSPTTVANRPATDTLVGITTFVVPLRVISQ